jgi:hypothetical protein
MVTFDIALPEDTKLLGWIERHPSDKEGSGYTIVRLGTGMELAWNGHNFRSLPKNWRELVPLSAESMNPPR